MSPADPARRIETVPLDLEPTPVVLSLDDDEPAAPEIVDAAASLLERRPRTESDLVARLAGRGYEDADVASAVDTLKRLGLVDDAAFALTWLDSRKGSRALGRAGLVAALEQKGVSRGSAEAALDASGYDEEAAAVECARGNLKRLSVLSPAKQAAKLQRMLASRGFEEEAVEAAVKAILPPEGWD
jgi:regulatory protein